MLPSTIPWRSLLSTVMALLSEHPPPDFRGRGTGRRLVEGFFELP
jgi:hypothetical protein